MNRLLKSKPSRSGSTSIDIVQENIVTNSNLLLTYNMYVYFIFAITEKSFAYMYMLG
jgi:hypothetical protein